MDLLNLFESDSTINEDSKFEENKDLEVYKVANRFKSLKLISGSEFTDEELDKFVFEHYGKMGNMRLKLARFVLQKLNFIPNNDVLLMLSCTSKAKVVVATAGSGKTTSLQIDLLISKMIDKAIGCYDLSPSVIDGTSVKVSKILYLNYNKHNVKPIEDKHISMCSAINNFIKKEESISNDIDSSTVHAFCNRWLKAFSGKLNLPEISIMPDDKRSQVWEAVIKPRWKKFYGDDTVPVDYSILDELYVFKVESMLEWETFFATAKFVDTGLKEDFTKSCISKYESMKKQMKLIDFTDYILLMIDALKNNDDIRESLQKKYKIIIADENQDFTRLMNELILLLHNPEYNNLIIVGDPDQTIYSFRGVSPDNMVTLTENLKEVSILGLDVNYRCPSNIVESSKEILNLNIMRFDKPIKSIKSGGLIVPHAIGMDESQEEGIINILKRNGQESYIETVITYRNNLSSILIGEELYYNNIPFNVIDTNRPFSNNVFRHIFDALKSLQQKDNFELNKKLYRFLPVSREQWFIILDENRKQRRNHIYDVKVSNNLPSGCIESLGTLMKIADMIDTAPTETFIKALLALYRKYYFDFLLKQNYNGLNNSETERLTRYFNSTLRFFSRPYKTFDYFIKELAERNIDNPAGITLSTFHGLKGLEFDYVIAIDFNEKIFPNYFGIEQKYNENTMIQEKESENRLCYVLSTRARKELHLFYDNIDPSVYVGLLCKNNDVDKEDTPELNIGMLTNNFSGDSKLNFVQKLLNGRV